MDSAQSARRMMIAAITAAAIGNQFPSALAPGELFLLDSASAPNREAT
jgi:hypothetical protein